MIDWEKYNRSQAAISGLGFVEVDIKDYEEMRAAVRNRVYPGQQCGSDSPTVPDSKRLVVLEERFASHSINHVGWFDHNSGWWFAVSLNDGKLVSESIGNIAGWHEIT